MKAIVAADARRIRAKASSFPISHFSSPLRERELARLWQDQTFPPQALVTSEGETLRVIYRGRRGGGSGPDFRDALIAAPRGLLSGDVELHVRSSDFRRHGHHLDEAYASVVLHLVFHDDEGGPTGLPGGGFAAVAALADWVEGRAAEIARWLERPALWREPCFSALGRLGPGQAAAVLDRLGQMRFRQKAAAFASRLREMGNEKGEMENESWVSSEEKGARSEEEGGGKKQEEVAGAVPEPLFPSSVFLLPDPVPDCADQVLWEALLEALGYGGAPEPWRALAQRLSWSLLRERLAPLPFTERAPEGWRLLAAAGEEVLALRGRGRPAARPERRLRGAAALAARFADEGLVGKLAQLMSACVNVAGQCGRNEEAKHATRKRTGRTRPKRGPDREAMDSLVSALTVPGLVGRGRAVEIAGNAVLPCLAALGPEPQARRAEAAYAALPLPARYGAVRHLHEAVAGEKRKTKTENRSHDFRVSNFDFRRNGGGMRVDFRRQQGMLYLLRQYCTQGGCGRCPLS